ncbi:hypothetical protein GCM10011404_16100 [Sphingomonas prati]|uniref:O-antigen ligase domain-containing protein n=1 Tax=Sphingomonas prati TaxID=1843237 RepID=A0A7W9BSJ9_9SPHN|nr:hypothetical protein [Sphingomonas prati]GGE84195.1 hypothetical protein GCM10011404_16100 [Sphingomonas prati]
MASFYPEYRQTLDPRDWRAPGAAAVPAAGHPLIFAGFLLLMLFNVALPKGGIAAGDVPLTFGYMLVGLIAPLGLIGLIRRPAISPVAVFHFLALFLPLGLFTLYRIQSGAGAPVVLLTYSALFLILPLVTLIVFSSYLEALTERQIATVLKWCVVFVLGWGILNFLSYALFTHFIEVPYLTINAADSGEILGKNNRRGSLMKLVSTYNNGNVCGVCLLMLMPLFVHVTKSRMWTVLMCLAIILTLSRTAWFGLVCVLGIMMALRLIRVTNIFGWTVGIALAGVLILLLPAIGWTPDRLIDPTLGHRDYQWLGLQITLFGSGEVRVHEILYLGLLQSLGVIGLLLALAVLFFPVGYGLASLSRLSALRRSALAGIIAYLVVACLDAALIYPPVFLQFLFLVALLYRRGFAGAREAG